MEETLMSHREDEDFRHRQPINCTAAPSSPSRRRLCSWRPRTTLREAKRLQQSVTMWLQDLLPHLHSLCRTDHTAFIHSSFIDS